MGTEFQADKATVLEMDSGDNTALGVYLIPLNSTLRND